MSGVGSTEPPKSGGTGFAGAGAGSGREDRDPLPPSVSLATVAELNEGLVCLSGCARHGLGETRDGSACCAISPSTSA